MEIQGQRIFSHHPNAKEKISIKLNPGPFFRRFSMHTRLSFIILLLSMVFVVAACGNGSNTSSSSGSSSNTGPKDVRVDESEYTITSDVSTFTPGVPYHFVVTNTGKVAHEFMIMPSSMGSMNGTSMGNMDKMALVAIDTMNPGESKSFAYTFASSTAGSHPEFACYLPGHYDASMKLDVSVAGK
jgi:uncharacterized cupredoxin-like copper-binding protein